MGMECNSLQHTFLGNVLLSILGEVTVGKKDDFDVDCGLSSFAESPSDLVGNQVLRVILLESQILEKLLLSRFLSPESRFWLSRFCDTVAVL